MTEEVNEQPTAQAAETQPSLEDLHKEFSPREQTQPAQSAPQQPAYQPASQPQDVPDPVTDPDRFKAYLGSIGQNNAALQNQILDSVRNELRGAVAQFSAKEEERDIQSVVSKIKGDIDLDPLVVESYLGARYRQDPKIKDIWDNRNNNPAAFGKFVAFMQNEVKSKFALKQDHQLTENNRAMDQATRASQSSSKSDNSNEEASEKILSMERGDFQRWYQEILNS